MKFLIVSGALLPMNCTVTEWSAWSEPYGFGQIARERHVRMHALNNGTECPELEDRLFTGKYILRCFITKQLFNYNTFSFDSSVIRLDYNALCILSGYE